MSEIVNGGAVEIAADPVWTATGDMVIATGEGTATVITVGSHGKLLTPDSTQETGLAWKRFAAINLYANMNLR